MARFLPSYWQVQDRVMNLFRRSFLCHILPSVLGGCAGAQVIFRIGLSKKGHPQVVQVKSIVLALVQEIGQSDSEGIFSQNMSFYYVLLGSSWVISGKVPC